VTSFELTGWYLLGALVSFILVYTVISMVSPLFKKKPRPFKFDPTGYPAVEMLVKRNIETGALERTAAGERYRNQMKDKTNENQ
jgi:hypothetical protein